MKYLDDAELDFYIEVKIYIYMKLSFIYVM